MRNSAVTPAKKVSKYSIRSSTSSESRSPGGVGRARLQRPAVAAGQDRYEIGFAGLARPEHAHAHAPARRTRELAALVTDLLQFADQRRCLLGDGGRAVGGGAQPAHAFAGRDGQRFAILCKFE